MTKLNFFVRATLLVTVLFGQAAGAAGERYNPSQAEDIGKTNFLFLKGDWLSTDPKQKFSESWHESPDGCLLGVRHFFRNDERSISMPEYDLILFEPTGRAGANRLTLRRMGLNLSDLTPDEIVRGSYASNTTNRGVLTFKGQNGFQIISNYDSPNDTTLDLNLTISLDGKDSTSHVQLKRVSEQSSTSSK
jgi:hypothetical protein